MKGDRVPKTWGNSNRLHARWRKLCKKNLKRAARRVLKKECRAALRDA